MNLSSKDLQGSASTKLSVLNKSTALNPNAAEFVPSALRISSGSINHLDVSKVGGSGSSGKAVLDRNDSTISSKSDEEAHQYWRRQLPDDITPDFKFMAGDEQPGPSEISLAGLSLHDGMDLSRFSSSMSSSQLLSKAREISLHGVDDKSDNENMLFYVPAYGKEQSSSALLTLPSNPWDKQLLNNNQHLSKGREELALIGDSSAGFSNGFLSEHVGLDDSFPNHLTFLAKEFPGFAAESLAGVYYASGCDLNSTIEMLTQLEVQGDAGLNQNISSKTFSAPNLSTLDFSALSVADSQNDLQKYAGDDIVQPVNPYRSIENESFLSGKSSFSGTSRNATNFASVVQKLASPESGHWKYEGNGSSEVSIGTSRTSQHLSNSITGNSRSLNGGRLQNYGMGHRAPIWLDTGDVMANMYSELREEVQDHAHVRNAYFDQARQAYLIGDRALAKELSVKGQLHNMHMKAAHGKARESIFQQRNPSASNIQGYVKGQERMIDLNGLHVNEAIHVLKHELSIVRNTARTASQRLQVYICVGNGHQTKGSRTPARLPIAVERYLLEEEGLEYSEPQPGLLRVVIY
ncbi:polyadenylate-binding protein-interacting protein 7-like [Nymphaea colorata]|nr:polyadenylate-binding protein-interacting protein 7-like [Nymphaea colorata]XP_031492139.1 polyadenylate-binding protein-interacting protein 7-like [Nymphaea colorata]